MDLISRVLDMGFFVDSRMLVHVVHAVCSISGETFSRKIELFRNFGFSEEECMDMVRRTPALLIVSEGKLKLGIDFFLKEVKLGRNALVSYPICLMFSMEKRVVPRYRVLRVIMSKGLLQKEPSLSYLLTISEVEFLGRFISRFPDDGKEILEIYKGDLLDS
ncbi:transcription termination factor MTEF1, chloroplastic-like [Rhododendron vialii]|uniref:transcription termination factor MTEF1, chloroplastic-like n=1 Tax=Rhododendron vialii TaxID=182163 RepID=UPI00265EE4AE|nr:transcription termination factor MTEF1, chloroplastic-like [Rhododendron vialii]